MCSFPGSPHFPWSQQPPSHPLFLSAQESRLERTFSLSLSVVPTALEANFVPGPFSVPARDYNQEATFYFDYVQGCLRLRYIYRPEHKNSAMMGQALWRVFRSFVIQIPQIGEPNTLTDRQGRDFSAFLIAFISQVTEFCTMKTEIFWLGAGGGGEGGK